MGDPGFGNIYAPCPWRLEKHIDSHFILSRDSLEADTGVGLGQQFECSITAVKGGMGMLDGVQVGIEVRDGIVVPVRHGVFLEELEAVVHPDLLAGV